MLAEYIFKNRKTLNTTILAAKAGIDRSTLSRIANGKALPSLRTAKKISDATNGYVTVEEIIRYCMKEDSLRTNKVV